MGDGETVGVGVAGEPEAIGPMYCVAITTLSVDALAVQGVQLDVRLVNL